MALELESLLFRVETTQLDDARIKLAKLGDAVNALNKPMQDMARSSAKTNEVIAKSELAAEKARVAHKALAEGVEEAGDKMSRVEKNLEKITTGLQIFRGETISVKDASITLGDSFTKSQANFLAMQLQMGATAEQLKSFAKEFMDFNKMTSTNTFDNSVRGIERLRQETKELAEVDKLMREGIALTKDQIVNLTRDSERLTQAYKSMNKSEEELSGALLKLRDDTIQAAKAKNTYIEAAKQSEIQAKKEADALLENAKAAKLVNDKLMQDWASTKTAKSPVLEEMNKFYQEQEKLMQNGMHMMDQAVLKYRDLETARNKASTQTGVTDAAAAEAYLAKETERVNRLIEAKGEITSSTNNRLIKYEQALKASGVSSEVAAAKLAKYKEQLLETQKVAGNRQMDYLSRALGPQITDIFVGLATGQNPMTVLLQQGGQLRDQFALAGIAAEDMGKALSKSLGTMYSSIEGVAMAIGGLLVDAFIKVGSVATTAITKITGDFFLIQAATTALTKLFPELTIVIEAFGAALNFALGATAIAAVVGLAVAFKQIVQEESAMSKALVTTGAALGFTKQSAIEFAQSLEAVSESKAKDFLTELAKNSVENTGNLKALTKSAVDLEKYAGISLDETAKRYAELQKKPVEGLTKLAVETGRVSVATLLHAENLKEAKKYTELAALANTEFARVMSEVGAVAYSNMSPIEKILSGIAKEARSGWDSFKEWANTPEVLKVVETSWKAISTVFKILLSGVKQIITGIGALVDSLTKLGKLDMSGAMDSLASGWENIQKIGAETVKDLTNPSKDSGPGAVSSAAGDTTANARAAKLFEQQKKDREEARKKAEAESKKLLEQQKKDMDVYNDLMNKAEGQNKAYNNSLDSLNRLRKEGKITQEQYNDALGYLIRSQPGYVKQMQDLTQAAEEYDKAVKEVAKTVKGLNDSAAVEEEKLNLRQKLLGLSADEQARVNAEYEKYSKLKKIDLDLENDLNAAKAKFTTQDFDLVQKPQIIAAYAKLRENVERESSIKIAENQIEEFNKARDAISGAIADAFFEGGKKGADSLKNYLKTTFRKFVIDVFINPVVGGIMGSFGIQGAVSGTAGSFIGNMGSSALTNAIGGISGIASAFGTAFSNAALSTVQGWVGMSGTAAQMGTSLANAGYYAGSAAGTTASGIGATVGAYAPYVLAAVAAYEVLKGNGGETRSGATYVQDSNGLAMYQQGPSGGEIAGGTSRALFNSTKNSIESVLKQVGSSAALTGFTAGLESSSEGKGFAFAGGFIGGQSFGASSGREGYRTGQWSYKSMNAEEAMAAYVSELNKATLQALIAATDVPNLIKNQLQGIDFKTISDQDVQKLVSAVNETIYAVNNFITEINWLGIKGLDNIDFSNASKLIEVFGDVSKAGESLSFFYDNFYSKEEKMLNLNTKLSAAFEGLGLSMPKTTQEFRDLMQGALGSGNYSLAASLAKLQVPLVDLIGTADDATKAFLDLTNSIQKEIDRLLGANTQDSSIQGSAMRNEFDILSAMARSGDASALARLPEFSQAIEKNMQDFATSASDVIFARAMLAQSLTDTLSALGGSAVAPSSVAGVAGSSSPTILSNSVVQGGSSLSTSSTSQSDLISSLIAEIQGLRAEVRADVSVNTKTSKILERANQDGETLSISGSVDGGTI